MRSIVPGVLAALAAAGVVAACTTAPPKPTANLNDGELAIPADYKSWPKFLSAVQRPDAKWMGASRCVPPCSAAQKSLAAYQ